MYTIFQKRHLILFLNKSLDTKRIKYIVGIATTKKMLVAAKEDNNVFPKMKFAKGIAKIKLISSPIQEATRPITSVNPTIKSIGFQIFKIVPKTRLKILATEDNPFLRVPLVFLFSPKLFFWVEGSAIFQIPRRPFRARAVASLEQNPTRHPNSICTNMQNRHAMCTAETDSADALARLCFVSQFRLILPLFR